MYTAVFIALIVIFGASLMGKMLRDMYPDSLFGSFFKKNPKDAPTAD